MNVHSSKGERVVQKVNRNGKKGKQRGVGFFGYILTLPTSTTILISKGDRTCNKFVKGCAEYYIFPISGDSRIQYARTRFGTIGCTIRVHDTGARILYHDRHATSRIVSFFGITAKLHNQHLIPSSSTMS